MTPRAVWQVSAGLQGPGDAGPWLPSPYTDPAASYLRRFVERVAPEDVLLLRTGVATVAAVGTVASDYIYEERFDDVNGWDLQHARRVRWSRLSAPHTFSTRVFGANPARFSRVRQSKRSRLRAALCQLSTNALARGSAAVAAARRSASRPSSSKACDTDC